MELRGKFLLVHPEISRTKYNFAGVIDNESLELEYIVTILKEAGYSADIWDGQVEKCSFQERLKEIRPDYVYVCGRTRQENFMKEYCRDAKDICGCVTFVGGLHVQQNYKRFYEDYIDYILTSFDIFHITEILSEAEPDNIEGLCYKKNGEWKHNESVPFDINRLPLPDRKYFYEHNNRYRYLELLPCAHVRTAYCCPYRCTFCSRNKMNCGVYSARDIESVVDEIEHIDCENIYFIDDDFLFDEQRILKFIELIRERNIKKKYVCYGRADFITAHPELMTELKKIGFYYILTGLEAISDRYLEKYNKKSDMSCNEKAVKILNEAGINIMGMFIVDLDFRPADFRNIYKWVCSNNLKHTAISIFTPEMSSPLMEKYRDKLVTDDPSAWDYLHVVAEPDNLSVKKYYFHYHILMARLFLKGQRDGIYDFIDYGFYIKSFLKNMFRFGG